MTGVEPTTGGPYDGDYRPPAGCTGYYREDLDWGDVLVHAPDSAPCPLHRLDRALLVPRVRTYVAYYERGRRQRRVTVYRRRFA